MKKSAKLRALWYRLSPRQRFLIRRLYYLPSDLLDSLSGKRHKYVPPRGAIYTGSPAPSAEYLEQGLHQLELLKEEAHLEPTSAVLDIGSGVGRTAIALSGYLEPGGRYEGFDVVQQGVDWCNNTIGKDYPNFHFKYIPLFNDLYNSATENAADFVFPYEDDTFDTVFTFSVFTHMQIEEIQHYFEEIHRVMKAGGTCLSTFFLYDTTNESYIATKNDFNFPVEKDGYRLMDENVTSGNIAIEIRKLHQMIENAGLKVDRIIEGFWKDEIRDPEKKEYQDIVVFQKN